MRQIKIYAASYVLPSEGDVIPDSAVVVSSGRIAAIGPLTEIREKYKEAKLEEFGEVCLMPGLINSHAHLDLTIMRGYLDPYEDNFLAWLRKLTSTKRELLSADDLYISSAVGAIEAARAGCTTLLDVSDRPDSSLRAMSEVGLKGIVYKECFGPDSTKANETFDVVQKEFEELKGSETELVKVGISPHAPYSVSAPLLSLIAQYCVENRVPLMMHAAESLDEERLLSEGKGTFAEGLRSRGIQFNVPKTSTTKYLHSLGVLDAAPLLAHCVRVNKDDLALIKQSGSKISHCPKSNTKLGHGIAPLKDFIRNGIRTSIGTDSVASNNLCDLLEELRFATLLSRAKGFMEMDANRALSLITSTAAECVDMEECTGKLEVGAPADFIAVALNNIHQLPAYGVESAILFSSSGRDVLLTVVGGREVYKRGKILTVDEASLISEFKKISGKLVQTYK
jgi:cytosine/adenosine deaminase-related metal-dependent hydrolase